MPWIRRATGSRLSNVISRVPEHGNYSPNSVMWTFRQVIKIPAAKPSWTSTESQAVQRDCAVDAPRKRLPKES